MTASLNNLPIEIYHFYLFSYIDIDDLFRLRLISKYFYSIVRSYEVIELSFTKYDNGYDHRENWISTTSPIKVRNFINISKINFLRNPSTNILDLKYLRIRGHNLIALKDLRKFNKLIILDIEKIRICNDLLQLPELKALSIGGANLEKDNGFEIDAPNLQYLRIRHCFQSDFSNMIGGQIKFKNPHSLKFLHLHVYRDCSIFKNLEVLELNSVSNKFKSAELFKLRKLRKVRINYLDPSHKYVLKEFYVSNSGNLEIVLDGVKIKKLDKLDEYNNYVRLEWMLKNYGDLEDDLNHTGLVHYNVLDHFLPKLPSDFFIKYTNIQWLVVFGKVNDDIQLIRFINRCSNLINLKMNESSLGQQFYNKVPDVSLLSSLEILENDIILNFKFINRFSYLTLMSTNQDIRIDKSFNLNSLKYLKELYFNLYSIRVNIKKEDNDRYLIGGTQKRFSFDDLIKHLDYLASKSSEESTEV